MVEKLGYFSGWFLQQGGGAGLLENIALYSVFVLYLKVVTIYRVGIKRDYMVACCGCVCVCVCVRYGML